jgi:GNAT superfamily N-acetyltransferase
MASSEEQIVICSSEEMLLLAPNTRAFLNGAYEGDFSDSDYENALGGRHFILFESGQLIAHASVVTRSISIDDSAWKVGYVEAVAVASDFRDRGLGRQIMQQVTDFCRGNYEVAMLSTGEHGSMSASVGCASMPRHLSTPPMVWFEPTKTMIA